MNIFSKFWIFIIFGSILSNFESPAQPWLSIKDKNDFFSMQKEFNNYWEGKEIKRGEGWKQFKRWEYFWEQRLYPSGEFPNALYLLNSYNTFLNKITDENQLQDIEPVWNELGPKVVPTNRLAYQSGGLGRLNVVRIHPFNDNVIWVGSAGGGAWSTTNKGQTWKKANFTDILSIGISDIAFAPTSPDVMYIATGDANGSFMTGEYSIGVLKSTDNGNTWRVVTQKYKPNDYFLSTKILIHPTNYNIVYVATSRGIIQTTDGGENWKTIFESNSIVRDIEFKPDNPNVIYASNTGRIHRSTDGGTNWSSVYTFSGASRIELAVTPSDPNYLYAVGVRGSSGSFGGLVRSTDGGTGFSVMSTSPNILSIEYNGSGNSGQGNYDLAIVASPVDKEQIYVGGIHAWVSKNGGKDWKILNHWTGSYNLPYVHADQHNFVINAKNLELFAANDGGLYSTTDNGISWNDLSDGLAISQFYRINVSSANPNTVIGGTQDNGTFLFKGNAWYQVNGGDGMDCAIDNQDDNFAYSTTQYGNLFRSSNGGFSFSRIAGPDLFQGESANWITPFVLNPQRQSTIFIGYRNLYKSTNRGASWTKLTNFSNTDPIRVIAISDIDSNFIYISVNSTLYRSIDGGKNFASIRNFNSTITDIATDPQNPQRVFVTCSGYREGEKVFEVSGTVINNISFNLPNIPVSTVVYQNNTGGRLFIGTDIGVMIRSDELTNEWLPFGEGLPPAVVSDLKINYSAGKLYAGTYGRGLWEVKLYDCDLIKPQIKVTGNIEFCTGDSVVLEAITDYPEVKWSTGETSKEIVIKKSGNYFVNVKDEKGCSSQSDYVNLTEAFVPSFTIRSNKDFVLCGEDTISLSVPIGFKEYKWSNGDTTNRINVYEPGYYVIQAKSAKDCIVMDSVYIYMRPVPDKPDIYGDETELSTDSAHSYKWFVDDVEIPNSNMRKITPNKTGKYYVIVFNEFGCGATSESKGVVTSINNNEISSNNFLISPNPFDNYVRVTTNLELRYADVKLVDVLGKTIFSDTINFLSNGNDYLFLLEGILPGNYFLIIRNGDSYYTHKIIKIK